MNVKRKLYEGLTMPTALNEAEIWCMAVTEKKRLNVMEMRYLRSMYCMRNEEVRRRTGVKRIGWWNRAVCVEMV